MKDAERKGISRTHQMRKYLDSGRKYVKHAAMISLRPKCNSTEESLQTRFWTKDCFSIMLTNMTQKDNEGRGEHEEIRNILLVKVSTFGAKIREACNGELFAFEVQLETEDKRKTKNMNET